MLNSVNCSTVICLPTVILMLSREATSETYGPQVYLYHIDLLLLSYLLCYLLRLYFTLHLLSYKFLIYFYLHLLLSNLYHKNTKNIYFILLSLSDLTFASYSEGIDNPFIALVARFLFVCVGTWDLRGSSYWIDTLVLEN